MQVVFSCLLLLLHLHFILLCVFVYCFPRVDLHFSIYFQHFIFNYFISDIKVVDFSSLGSGSLMVSWASF